MSVLVRNTFKKSERLCSRLLMDRLFQGDSLTVSAYPFRAVFLPVDQSEQQGVSVLISVPKKRFHDAIDRNRVKRQIREAYRKNKHSLIIGCFYIRVSKDRVYLIYRKAYDSLAG